MFFPECYGKPTNRMQDLLDQLPGMTSGTGDTRKTNPGFAIIDRKLNGFKGYMFQEDLSWIKPATFGLKLDAVRTFILLFRMIKDAEFQDMFDKTNHRVYSAFATIDEAIQANNMKLADGVTPLPHDWAAGYQKWLEAYLNRMSGHVWTWTWDKWTDLQTRHQLESPQWTPQTRQDWGGLFDAINQAPDFKQDDFICDFRLTWRITSQPLHRRQPLCPASLLAAPSTRSTLLISQRRPVCSYSLRQPQCRC